MPEILRSFSGRYAALSPLFQSGFFFEGGEYQSAAAAFVKHPWGMQTQQEFGAALGTDILG
ncbi:hypothetical protein HDF14_003954 [Edaphobacter lichenicola]|uniref:Uncharacterized protein n=1 Tax=Tunturiibacter gelidiferens TaxID=3069689 RepID=A0A9X0QHD9_9BACT|nr:hypothetical protein [Edaphobacter lichenicola]